MEAEVKTIEMRVRPRRIAFLVHPEEKFQICKDIIGSCCIVWGGIFNLFIPTDGNRIDKLWWDFIDRIDPDSFLAYTEIKSKLRQELLRKTTPFNLLYPNKAGWHIIPDDPQSMSSSYNLSMSEVRSELQNEIYPKGMKSLSLIIPEELEDYQFAAVGTYPGKIWRKGLEKISQGLFSADTEFGLNLEYCSIQRDNTSPIGLTNLYLRMSSQKGMNFVLVIGDSINIKDFSLYWNLRSVSLMNEIFWMPLEILEKDDKFEQFLGWINSIYPRVTKIDRHFTTVIELMSLSLPKSKLDSIARVMNKKLIGPLQAQTWKKRDLSNLLPNNFEIYNPKSYVLEEKLFYQKKAKVQCPRPHFVKSDNDIYGSWVVDINLLGSDDSPNGVKMTKYVGVPELFIPLRNKRGDLQKDSIRISKYGFSCRVSAVNKLIPIQIPSDIELFRRIFKLYHFDAHVNNKLVDKNDRGFSGFEIVLSDKGIYTNEVIKRFGGLSSIAGFLKLKDFQSVLNEYISEPEKEEKEKKRMKREKVEHGRRRELSKQEIVSLIERCDINDRKNGTNRKKKQISENSERKAERMIQQLMNYRVLLPGFCIKCQECRNIEWYSINEIGNSYICHRCYSDNITPSELEWKYRLAEIFFQAYYNNALVPILTLDLLKNKSKESFIFIPEVNVYKDKMISDRKKPIEIDICCISDGELIIGECKSSSKIEKKKMKQYKYLARRLRVNKLIFCCFTDEKCRLKYESCIECRKTIEGKKNFCYADSSFSYSGTSSEPSTKEMIQKLREELSQDEIDVCTFCKYDLLRSRWPLISS